MSDLHFGAKNGLDDPALERALGELIERVEPALVIVSGDLSHGGRRGEHEEAARYLRGLGPPLLVIPGNHDIPTFPPARVVKPWHEFERLWETTQPAHSTPTLEVVGLNSVRPWGYQTGRVDNAQLERAVARFTAAPAGALRIAALHHQLAGAPWRNHKLPLLQRTRVLDQLAAAGADLIVSGHVHQGTVCERREFEVVPGGVRGCVIATAPGLGRPRPDRRNEARGVLVYTADEHQLDVKTFIWREQDWGLTARRSFPRELSYLAERAR